MNNSLLNNGNDPATVNLNSPVDTHQLANQKSNDVFNGNELEENIVCPDNTGDNCEDLTLTIEEKEYLNIHLTNDQQNKMGVNLLKLIYKHNLFINNDCTEIFKKNLTIFKEVLQEQVLQESFIEIYDFDLEQHIQERILTFDEEQYLKDQLTVAQRNSCSAKLCKYIAKNQLCDINQGPRFLLGRRKILEKMFDLRINDSKLIKRALANHKILADRELLSIVEEYILDCWRNKSRQAEFNTRALKILLNSAKYYKDIANLTKEQLQIILDCTLDFSQADELLIFKRLHNCFNSEEINKLVKDSPDLLIELSKILLSTKKRNKNLGLSDDAIRAIFTHEELVKQLLPLSPYNDSFSEIYALNNIAVYQQLINKKLTKETIYFMLLIRYHFNDATGNVNEDTAEAVFVALMQLDPKALESLTTLLEQRNDRCQCLWLNQNQIQVALSDIPLFIKMLKQLDENLYLDHGKIGRILNSPVAFEMISKKYNAEETWDDIVIFMKKMTFLYVDNNNRFSYKNEDGKTIWANSNCQNDNGKQVVGSNSGNTSSSNNEIKIDISNASDNSPTQSTGDNNTVANSLFTDEYQDCIVWLYKALNVINDLVTDKYDFVQNPCLDVSHHLARWRIFLEGYLDNAKKIIGKVNNLLKKQKNSDLKSLKSNIKSIEGIYKKHINALNKNKKCNNNIKFDTSCSLFKPVQKNKRTDKNGNAMIDVKFDVNYKYNM